MLDFINSLTSQQLFLIGGLVASLPGTYAIVEYIKNRHFRKKAEDLWSGFVVLNVLVWGSVLTFVDALAANFSQITHIGTLIPQVASFVSVWGPRVSGTLLVIHIVATALSKWFKDREAKKPLTNVNTPDLAPALQALTTPIPPKSFGTAAAGVDVIAPGTDLLM